ncbi:glycosyltransferase [Candidatus Daviesbacteria bacterium]|nr:glycosyltransferase [Candidatus Daviesbacteria bacterium]
MRVALVHDDLVQWGGAERVLFGFSKIYPDAPIYTSLFDRTNSSLMRNFGTKKIITSFLQKIPGWKGLYKVLLPLYPLAFEQFNFDQYDLVISHTTRFAKSIITKPATVHICYCHTPPRFLWHFSGEQNYGLGEILLTKLRLYDQVSARRVDHFIGGSKNAKRRIKRVYGVESKVVYPFVDLERFTGVERFDGGYFVVISRPSKYKRVDLAAKACSELGVPLRVIGGLGDFRGIRGIRGVEFLEKLDDRMVINILAGCKALIIPGVEDFGLTSLEAQALGKPVVAFKEGGALETVIESKTGIFFDKQTVDSLKKALMELDTMRINPEDCRRNAEAFGKEKFIKTFQQTVASLLYTRKA